MTTDPNNDAEDLNVLVKKAIKGRAFPEEQNTASGIEVVLKSRSII